MWTWFTSAFIANAYFGRYVTKNFFFEKQNLKWFPYLKKLKEIGHPCIIAASISDQEALEAQTEPITPKKLIDLLIK